MYVDGMPRQGRSSEPAASKELNVNQIVAYNLRAARKIKKMTQEDLARQIETVSKKRCTPTMVSELERAWDGPRRREFDAHEIAVFSLALDVPMAYFFLPPINEYRNLENLNRTASQLHLLVFGDGEDEKILDDRMLEVGKHLLPVDKEWLADFTGNMGPWTYRWRRKKLVMALLEGFADDFDEAIGRIGAYIDQLREAGIRGFIAEKANEPDVATLPERRASPRTDDEEPSDTPSGQWSDDSSDDDADASHDAVPTEENTP